MRYCLIALLVLLPLMGCVYPEDLEDPDTTDPDSTDTTLPYDDPGMPQPGDMQLIPAGAFMMGIEGANSNERPVHEVYLDAYYIDYYEVTNAQYREYVQATNAAAPASFSDPDHYPVYDLTWEQAKNYCEWAGKRLPLEAEWEKAARGTDQRRFPWGNEIDPSKANYQRYYKDLSPVGSFADGKSAFGLYDMTGNVWEWCEDFFDRRYYDVSPRENPTGPASGGAHVIRGGSWVNSVGFVTATARSDPNPEHRMGPSGVRCARDAE